MLRFNLFGFPISVHWMFWLVMMLLGGASATGLGNPLPYLLIFAVVAFVSVLWHELGHAFFQRKYGGRPEIMLYGMGGLSSAVGHFDRTQRFTISIMGPLFGLFLAGVTYIVAGKIGVTSSYVSYAISVLLWVNIAWSLFNLLPILPMDGGHVMDAILGPENRKTTLMISIGVAGVAAVLFAFVIGMPIAGMFCGYMAYQNFQEYKNIYSSPSF